MKFHAVEVGVLESVWGGWSLEVRRWYSMHGMTAVNLSNGCCFLNPVNTSFARARCHLPHTGNSFLISSEYKFSYVIDTMSLEQ